MENKMDKKSEETKIIEEFKKHDVREDYKEVLGRFEEFYERLRQSERK
jgi:hypothetical protein